MADMTRDEDIHGTVGPASGDDSNASESPMDGARFQIIRLHDEGGLGKVSVALDTELDREVALKEIKPQYADDASSRSRFLLEAEITGGLEHPGIVPIYALGASADGRPYYAMRFIRGDNLATAIKQYHEGEQASEQSDRTVQLRRLLSRFLDVSNAVYYAHQRGVLHRDLKPGNVMLGEYGETLVVDWGLAKPIGASEESTSESDESPTIASPLVPRSGSVVDATQLGSAIGSPHYMSPEQARGEHDKLGPAADVYSLGATLFTLLTNRKPVEGQSLEDILAAVQKGPTKTARQWNPEIDAALSKICAKAMSLSTEERYKTVRALADDVERYLADEPVRAYPEPLTRRTRRWMRKHPRLVGSATATLVAGVVSAATIAGVVSSSNAKLGEKNLELAEANTQLEVAKEDAETARDEALTARDEAVRAKEQAETVSEFLVTAFRAPDPDVAGRHLTVAQVMGWAAEQLDERFADDPQTKAALLFTLASTYEGLGVPEEAAPLCEQAVRLWQESLGVDDPKTLWAQNTLANIYVDLGEFSQAIDLHKQVLEKRRETLGTDHPSTINSLNNLAGAYRDSGDWKTGLPLQEESLEQARRVLGDDDLNTLTYMNNLAVSYEAAGRSAEALALQEQAHEKLAAQLGRNHPDTLTSMGNLATSYSSAGNAEKSLELQQEVYELMKAKLGPHHPTTLLAMNNLAHTYYGAGDKEKAFALHEKTQSQMKKHLGADHLYTLKSTLGFAKSYQESGEYSAAIEQLESSLFESHESLPPFHPLRVRAVELLAEAQSQQGQWQKASQLLQELLNYRVQTLGEEDLKTLDSKYHYAETLRNLGQYEQALAVHEETFLLRKKVLGKEHPKTLASMLNTAEATLRTGDQEEAVAMNEEALRLMRKNLGEDNINTLVAMSNLANAYLESGKPEKAIGLHKECYDLKRRTLGEDHIETITSQHNLAGTYLLTGQVEEAFPVALNAQQQSERKLGRDHPRTLESMHLLARLYLNKGDVEKSRELYAETLHLREQALGDSHPATLQTMNDLAHLLIALGQFHKAFPLAEKVVQLRRDTLGYVHPDTLTSTENLAYLCERTAKYAQAQELYGIYATDLQKLGREQDGVSILLAIERNAYCLIEQGKYSDAEGPLQWIRKTTKGSPDWFVRHDAASLLGAALLGQEKFTEAEALLLEGYQGLVKNRAAISYRNQFMLPESLARIVALYEAWEKPEKAERWRAELAKWEALNKKRPPKPQEAENPLDDLNFNFY